MTGKNILITFLIAVACALVLETCNSAPEIARELGPIPRATASIALDKREQEMQVTATYISVLGSEVVSDTVQTHAIARKEQEQDYSRSEAFADFWNECKIVIVGTFTFGIACISAGGGVYAGSSLVARGIENATTRIKRAIKAPPSMPLSDSANLMLIDGSPRIVDTRTKGTWSVEEDQLSSLEHAEALALFQPNVWQVLGQMLIASGNPTKAQIRQIEYLLKERI